MTEEQKYHYAKQCRSIDWHICQAVRAFEELQGQNYEHITFELVEEVESRLSKAVDTLYEATPKELKW